MFLFTYLISCRPDKKSKNKGFRADMLFNSNDPLSNLNRFLDLTKVEIAEIKENSGESIGKIAKDLLMANYPQFRLPLFIKILKKIEDLEELKFFIDKNSKIIGYSIDEIMETDIGGEETILLLSKIVDLEAEGYITFSQNNYRIKILHKIFDLISLYFNRRAIPTDILEKVANILKDIENIDELYLKKYELSFMQNFLSKLDDSKALSNALIMTLGAKDKKEEIKSIILEDMKPKFDEIFSEFIKNRPEVINRQIDKMSKELEQEVSDKLQKAKEYLGKGDMKRYINYLRKISFIRYKHLKYISENIIDEEDFKKHINEYFDIPEEEENAFSFFTRIGHAAKSKNPILREVLKREIMDKLTAFIDKSDTGNIIADNFNLFAGIMLFLLEQDLSDEEKSIILDLFKKQYSRYKGKEVKVINRILLQGKFEELGKEIFEAEIDKLKELIKEDSESKYLNDFFGISLIEDENIIAILKDKGVWESLSEYRKKQGMSSF